jgi:PIN domain nuclease of toxin-antitoxin system
VKLLLDTCTFLWTVQGGGAISATARRELAKSDAELYLSAVSVWEIAIKHALGRLRLPDRPERYVPAQRAARAIEPLALDEESALQVARLPALHRDPFDRMLIAQALAGGLVLVTPDPEIARYPVRTLW